MEVLSFQCLRESMYCVEVLFGSSAIVGQRRVAIFLKLVFTYDGVGVVIRSAARNDQVKIKPTESNTAFDAMRFEESDWQAEDCTGRA